jgi:DNA-binding PadR family transcriptional regulator
MIDLVVRLLSRGKQAMLLQELRRGEGSGAGLAERVENEYGRIVFGFEVYLILRMMERRGWLVSREEPRQPPARRMRIVYAILPAGEVALRRLKRHLPRV